jgi:cytochrome c-type protein NapC
MELHTGDSDDRNSSSLASRHARNELFGRENCYACHADYGMYGTIMTKIGGMRHVYYYYFTEFGDMSLDDAKRAIHLRKPYPNGNCMHCHSTTVDVWSRVPDHRAALDEVRSGKVSCASAGCHGLAHPFFVPLGESTAARASGDGR